MGWGGCGGPGLRLPEGKDPPSPALRMWLIHGGPSSLAMLCAQLLLHVLPSTALGVGRGGPPSLPLHNSTSVVFDSRFSPPGARAPVACYRVPAICSTPGGTLVAMSEAHIGWPDSQGRILNSSCGDCTVNGIAQRRSTDSGRTWGPYGWAVTDRSTDPSRPSMDVGGNPSCLYDRQRQRLVLQFVRGERHRRTQSQPCNPATTNWQQISTDEGRSWSSPVEISKYLGPWAGSLVGPSNGIQLQRGANRGRLVWCGHWGVYNSTQVWYSDNGGQSYTLSSTVFQHMDGAWHSSARLAQQSGSEQKLLRRVHSGGAQRRSGVPQHEAQEVAAEREEPARRGHQHQRRCFLRPAPLRS